MAEPPKSHPAAPVVEAPTRPPTPTPSPSSSGPLWKKSQYPNPPDLVNPDPVTLRDQWRYATRQYSRWYSSAWGAAILAGISFFALGWVIKGGNPLPSRATDLDEDHHRTGKSPSTAE